MSEDFKEKNDSTVEQPVQEQESQQDKREDKKEKKSDLKKLKNDYSELSKKYDDLKASDDDLLDRYRRLAAEFDNYKKRTSKEMDSRYSDARFDVIKQFIPVIDNFERAISAPCPEECKAYIQGVEMIYNQMTEMFKGLGVEEIDALGKVFDPLLHNAVLHTEDESVGENIIVEVFEKGYSLNGKVLRYSTVKVAN